MTDRRISATETWRRIRWTGDESDPDGLVASMKAFLTHLDCRGRKPATIRGVGYRLQRLAGWCDERGINRPVEITRPVIDLFHRFLVENAGVAPQSRHLYIHAIQSLFRWLLRENRILADPASHLEAPPTMKTLPRHVLTVAEIERLIACADPEKPMGLRDRAIMETLYSTGIRRGEVVALVLDDLRPDGTVFVHQGKGRRDRVVPIGLRAQHWLARYLAELRPRLSDPAEPDDHVFLTCKGQSLRLAGLTNLIKDFTTVAGLTKERLGSCHLFRHACATHMLEGGADIRFIQALLGHANLDTTSIYTQVTIGRLKEVHGRTHPAG